jgi:hypothetical protein
MTKTHLPDSNQRSDIVKLDRSAPSRAHRALRLVRAFSRIVAGGQQTLLVQRLVAVRKAHRRRRCRRSRSCSKRCSRRPSPASSPAILVENGRQLLISRRRATPSGRVKGAGCRSRLYCRRRRRLARHCRLVTPLNTQSRDDALRPRRLALAPVSQAPS